MSKKQKSKQDLGNFSKVYGKLRMIANGSNEVNAIRAITNQTIATRKQVIDQKDYLNITQQMSQKISFTSEGVFAETEIRKRDKRVTKADLRKGDIENDPPDQAAINVFIELRGSSTWEDVLSDIFPKLPIRQINERIKNVRKRGNIIKANIILDDLKLFAACEHIVGIEGSQSVLIPPLINITFGTKNKPNGLQLNNSISNVKSENTIIGIIDVGGFDYAHPDFLDKDGNTRFLAIWDQGGDFRPAPSATRNEYIEFNYGSLHTQERRVDKGSFTPSLSQNRT